ncbi:MAG: hypothetical protein J0L97_08775, partial [Alphaproteobacteria bacterium]|nr:hypothetical protein [Alphaproteobacteria bacterium]
VSLAVMIRAPKKKGYFVPENNLAKNYWFYVDMAQAREFTGLELLPFYAEAIGKAAKDTYPETSEPKVDFLNDHLKYAIIWYSLAVILVIFYVAYQRKKS